MIMKVGVWIANTSAFVLAVFCIIKFSECAIITRNEKRAKTFIIPIQVENSPIKENFTMEAIEEAVNDYIDLSNAFFSPAASESVREKRTTELFKTIAERARSGITSLQKLFSGGSAGSEGKSATGSRFRTFFSNLLNRILVFLTSLWDRITQLFRGRSSGEGGERMGLIARIRNGVASITSRFRFGKTLQSLLGPKSTEAPYVPDNSDADDSTQTDPEDVKSRTIATSEPLAISSTTTSTEISTVDVEGGYGFSDSSDFSDTELNIEAPSNPFGSFVPFPMDSDPSYHLNGQSLTYYTNYPIVPVSNPWITRIPRQDAYFSSF